MKQQTFVVQRIREMILQGQLAPGQRVTEAGVAEHLGISRTPVRQALPALAQEGLLVASGARGYTVREFTIQEILDAIDVRAALEGIAAHALAARGLPRAILKAFGDCLEEGDEIFVKRKLVEEDGVRYGQMNERFHRLILEGAGKTIVSDLAARCQMVPFASPSSIAFDSLDDAVAYDLLLYAHRQHHAIVDAMEGGEGARAEALLREHVNPQKQSMNLLNRLRPVQNTITVKPFRSRSMVDAAPSTNAGE
jgi:GntR family transcriptional regulator, vanillate catabolism transcriptional regulator